MAASAPQRLSARAAWLIATPVVPVTVAVVLGLLGIGDHSVWVDEGISIALVRLPTLDMAVYIARLEMHAAPYYVFLHPWLAISDSETWIRALSVVFGVVAVVATWAVGRRYGVGFGAALVLAVMPAFVEYMQHAKGYTLLAATSAVATLLLLRLIERPSLLRAVPYIVAAILLIYAHPVGAFVALAHFAIVLVQAPPRHRWRLLLVFVPVALGWLPMIRFALLAGEKFAWIEPLTPATAGNELIALAGGLLVAAVLAPALVLGLRRDAPTLWLLLPIGAALVVSLLLQPVIRHPYLFGVLPAAALVAVRSPRPLVAALVAVALVVSAAGLSGPAVREDWRSAAAWVAAEVEPADSIVFAPSYVRPAFGYYARVGEPLYPAVPWTESDLLRADPDAPRVAAAGRIWLVESTGRSGELPAGLAAELGARSPLARRDFAGNVRVTLLVPAEVPSP